MAGFTSLIPLIILLVVVGFGGFVGYSIYLWSNDLADQGRKKMESHNIGFTQEGGLRVGVKALPEETYADKTQKYVYISIVVSGAVYVFADRYFAPVPW